jgi:hypothetical protein
LADVYTNIVDELAISIFKAQNVGSFAISIFKAQNFESYLPNGMDIPGEMNVEYRTD